MASGFYKLFLKAGMTGGSNTDLTSEDVKVALVDTDDYTVDLDADEFLDDIAGGAVVATSAALSNVDFSGLAFDADDEVLSSVTGDESEALVVYVDTGSAGTSRLVAYIDSGSGLPFTPNGGNINLAWNASGIFTL